MKKAKQAVPNRQLSNERILCGWSQQEVADRIGTTPVNVSRWERGVTAPSPYFRQRLATLFGKSVEELGLYSQESPPSEASATSPQFHITTTEIVQDTLSPLPSQEAERVFAQREREEQPIPEYKTLAATPKPILSHFSRWHHWHSSRHPLAMRIVTLTALVLLVVLSGLTWFNATHPIATSGKGTAPTLVNQPVPAVYGVTGKLLLDDPLTSSPTQGGWNISDLDKRPLGCYFLNGAYHVRHHQSVYCLTNTFSPPKDLVYQITMTIVRGTHAGIVFRVDDSQLFFYYFQVNIDGSYRLYRSDPLSHNTPNPILAGGPSAAIHKGYNTPNLLGVKAIGPDISLYINSQVVTKVSDPTYTRGNIGAQIDVDRGQGEAEAAFRNAKVWAVQTR